MKKKLKIATVLPYKENYTFSKAQAAAIWVCDFFKYSKNKTYWTNRLKDLGSMNNQF